MTTADMAAGLVRPGNPSRRIPVLALVLVVLTFTQAWVMPLTGPDADVDGSVLIRILYLPTYALCLVLAAQAHRSVFAALVRAPALAALLALAALSALWSIAPDLTARRAVALLFTSLAGYLLADRRSWPELMEVAAAALALVVAGCFALALFVPSYGRMTELFPGAWRGVFFEKNGLGNTMSLSTMIFIAAAIGNPQRRRLWLAFTALAILLVLLSQSKTSLIALLAGLAAAGLSVLARRGPVCAVAAVFLAVAGALAVGIFLTVGGDALLAILGKDATLTGRTRLWAAVWPQVQARPWTGYGFGAVWTDKGRWGPQAWITKGAGFQATHAHDSWLDVWITVGVGGVILFFLSFAMSLGRAAAGVFRSGNAFCAFPFLVVYGVLTTTETVALVYNDVVWLLFVALTVRLAGRGEASAAAAP